MPVPSSCGMGICGNCKVKCVEGEGEMNHNGGITDENDILSCCGMPKGNIAVGFKTHADEGLPGASSFFRR
ncbi:2Fe-2S iron-sulfur cluster-binding protein [Pantoea ananatis]|uniref:2Fe-2S iron-sulfur cluster-binding protein n=1 Tax=Pantoea ananas TaxID=553 RepID=UPI0023AA1D5B|nr:2Fe-2S iron-sulfur cluster binding domain-containing protein [Pantoea ananatis]